MTRSQRPYCLALDHTVASVAASYAQPPTHRRRPGWPLSQSREQSRSTHPQLERDRRAPGAPRDSGRRARQPAGSRGRWPATPWRAEATVPGGLARAKAPLVPTGPGGGEEARVTPGVDAQITCKDRFPLSRSSPDLLDSSFILICLLIS